MCAARSDCCLMVVSNVNERMFIPNLAGKRSRRHSMDPALRLQTAEMWQRSRGVMDRSSNNAVDVQNLKLDSEELDSHQDTGFPGLPAESVNTPGLLQVELEFVQVSHCTCARSATGITGISRSFSICLPRHG